MWNIYKKHSWKFGVLVLLIFLIYIIPPKVDFYLNSEETYCKVYSINPIITGRPVGQLYKYKFEFVYQGKKYFGESTKSPEVEVKTGKIFKIKFLPSNPDINEILFDKEYKKKYYFDSNEH